MRNLRKTLHDAYAMVRERGVALNIGRRPFMTKRCMESHIMWVIWCGCIQK